MAFYLLIITVASLLISLDNLKKRYRVESVMIFVVSALVMFIPLAMRDCGVDYEMYQLNYQLITETQWITFLQRYTGSPEPLYVVLNYLAYYIFHSFQGVNFLCALFSIGFTFCGLYKFREYVNVGMSVWCFGFLYYITMYGLNRMMIAVSIVTWGYQYIVKKNFKKYIIWMIVAGLFHYSAFLMIPFYFIIKHLESNRGFYKNIKWLKVAIGVSVIFIFIYLIVPVVFGRFSWFVRYQGYFDLSFTLAALNNNFPSYIVIAFIILLRHRLNLFLEDNGCLITMLYLYIAICLISVIMPIHRVCYYFYPDIILLCGAISASGKIVSEKSTHKSNIRVFNVSMIIVGIAWLYQILVRSSLWAPFINPYVMGNLGKLF